MISDQTRRQKSREVSSRYLSSTVAPPSPSPSPPLAPNNNTKQKHKHAAFIRGLWPHSSKSHDENKPTTTTLADHLGHKKQKDSPFLSKQKSCTEFSRSESTSNTKNNNILKEYHTPVYGSSGSMRYNGKSSIPGRSSISSSMSSSSDVFDSNQVILPGRLSVDENVLRRRTSYYQMRSDSYSDDSESSDLGSPFTTGRNSYMASTLSSKSYNMNTFNSLPMNNSIKKSMSMKRANSSSKWESSPSRFGSPLFSTSKPPSVSNGKKNLLHIGLDLIKGKKGGSKLRSSNSDTITNMENVHQLRLLQNSLMQWRYANARSQVAHANLAAQCENDLFYASESMSKLRQSVVQKRLQLQKEKLEMKLNLILHSQMKMLEAWGDIERRHNTDISTMKDYLHAVVCMIPLIEGAKVDLESATVSFRRTSHLVATIKSMLSAFSPMAHDVLSELADIVTQENLLLEECFEHLKLISTLEMEETNLRCSIMDGVGFIKAATPKITHFCV